MSVTELVDTIPRPVTPGPETEELRRFHRDGTWTGRIHSGGMGPGTPAQLARGVARHHWIQDGRWVVGEYEQDQTLEDGTFLLKWELHWVCGWDPVAGEYKATIADNYGRAALLRGWIVADQMVFESTSEQPPFLRLTWELTPRGSVLWSNEMSADGSNWILIEDYEIEPEP